MTVSTDPPAADLGALTPELRSWLVAHANGTDSPSLRAGIPAALDLIDAQAARLAELEELLFAYESVRAPVNPLAARLAAVKAERDQIREAAWIAEAMVREVTRAKDAAYAAQAARLAAYDERERIAATLDCKTPKCPRARAVILTGPQPEPRYGTPGLFLVWWCSSCGTQWSHWERAGAVEAGEARDG